MLDYYNDYNFKLDYDPQNNKFGFQKNTIGASGSVSISVATITYTDSNSIFVSDTTGNDSTGDGTQSTPYKTILKGIDSCTSTKIYVIVLDSVLYSEELDSFDNDYFSGLYAATAQTPTLSLRVLDYTPSDGNTIYVSKSGNDANAGTAALPKLTINGTTGATSAVTAGKPNILIADSGTYIEEGWEFTGNIKNLRAALGETPIVTLTENEDYFSTSQQISDTNLSVSNYILRHDGTCSLSNGKIFIVNTVTGPNAFFYILNEDYTFSNTGTNFKTLGFGTDCETLSSDNVILVYADTSDGYKGKYQIVDSSGNSVKAETIFVNKAVATVSVGAWAGPSVSILKGFGPSGQDYAVFAYTDTTDSDKGKYTVIDLTDDSIIKAETTFHTGATDGIGVSVSDDKDYVAITFGRDSDYSGRYVLLETSGWTETVSSTEFETDVYMSDCCFLKNNLLNIIHSDNPNFGSSATTFYQVIEPLSNTNIIAKTQLYNEEMEVATTMTLSGDIFLLYSGWAGFALAGLMHYQTYRTDQYLMEISTDAIFNGITFDATNKEYMSKYILGNSAKIDMSWCTFDEINSSTTNQESWCIYSDDEVNADHCSLHDSQKGIYQESNLSIIEDNEFYRINDDYAVHIKGTAASSGDITVEHNTFFDNYSALRLEDNHGTNEIVKNNILHDNSVYDINATTAMSFTYSTYTGTLNNASAGASVVKSNPLFINEGSLDPDDTDLQIKLRVLGYPTDSPAYLLADDTAPDRDAGSWNVTPIGAITTWTEITIEKPSSGISVKHDFIGSIVTRKKDGDLESDYDDVMEIVEFTFKGLLNADWTSLMDMLTCGNNEVRLYPDPDTNPNSYNVYKIVYENVSSAVKQFRLSRTGVQDFGFTLARAFEL